MSAAVQGTSLLVSAVLIACFACVNWNILVNMLDKSMPMVVQASLCTALHCLYASTVHAQLSGTTLPSSNG